MACRTNLFLGSNNLKGAFMNDEDKSFLAHECENDVATGKGVIGMADEYYVVDGVVYFSREAAQAARESK